MHGSGSSLWGSSYRILSDELSTGPAWYGLLPRTANLKENLPDQILVVEVRWSWFGEGEFLTYGGRNDSEILAVENFYNLGSSNCRREARMKVEMQLSIEPSQGASILFFTG